MTYAESIGLKADLRDHRLFIQDDIQDQLSEDWFSLPSFYLVPEAEVRHEVFARNAH